MSIYSRNQVSFFLYKGSITFIYLGHAMSILADDAYLGNDRTAKR